MTVSKRLRFEILRRDNNACKVCGRTPPEVKLHVDHVVPVALGGGNEPSNLQTLCSDCNGGKSSVPADAPVVADVAADAQRWSLAMQQVAEMRAAELNDVFQMVDWFMSIWDSWTDWRGDTYDASGAQTTIPQFIKAGLTTQEIEELVGVTMQGPASGRDKWKYFCGCCWRRIRQNQELAAELMQSQTPSSSAFAITTRWTEDDLHHLMTLEGVEANYAGGFLECEDHADGLCESDMLCQIVAAARTRESIEAFSIRKHRKAQEVEAINDAAEEAEDYVYG